VSGVTVQARAITGEKLRQLVSRVFKASRFNSDAYLELKEDEKATGQAVAALFLACLGYAIGFTLFTVQLALDAVLVGILANLLLSLLAALVWAITAFLVGTKLFQGKTRFWGLARPLFFSASPGILFILIAVPLDFVSRAIAAAVSAWVIIAGVVALKNAMGFGYDRSMLTYIVGFLIGIALAGFFRL
jgi:hypothetical protein